MIKDKEAHEFDKWFNDIFSKLRTEKEIDMKLDQEVKRNMFQAWKARGNLAKDIEDHYFKLIEKLRKLGVMD